MPITKEKKKRNPLWKEWDRTAQKVGARKTIYSVSGEEYTGDWKENKKDGKGVQFYKSGARYDGDWKAGKRHGFGTYSVKNSGGELVKQYAGGWKNDKKHGYGTHFYSFEEYYEGEWYSGKRSGWGRMYYADEAVYEGEWFGDKRNGRGLLRLGNGNRYEGSWENDMKHGQGKFLHLDKGQIYTGHWKENVAKTGTLEDFDRDKAPDAPQYLIPACMLSDPDKVLEKARTDLDSALLN